MCGAVRAPASTGGTARCGREQAPQGNHAGRSAEHPNRDGTHGGQAQWRRNGGKGSRGKRLWMLQRSLPARYSLFLEGASITGFKREIRAKSTCNHGKIPMQIKIGVCAFQSIGCADLCRQREQDGDAKTASARQSCSASRAKQGNTRLTAANTIRRRWRA